MSDDNPPSSNAHKKGWFEKVSQLFQGEPQSRDELVEVIHDAEQREVISEDTREMIKGVLEVSDLRVRDIMIPRAQIVALKIDNTVEELLSTVIGSAHSRFPVVNEDKDHIEGILLAKDLLQYGFKNNDEPFSLEQVIRPAVVVPESKRVDVLLKEFRSQRYHMAIVVDEYGGVSGLVTIEDILEEIVGEIEDEFDHDSAEETEIRKVGKQIYMVKALTPIDDFNETFGTQFSDEEFDTVGGLVSHAFGHLPERNEKITIDEIEFKVISADTRRLVQLRVKLPDPQTEEENA
ncbi:CNNM family magnesium/cobalt transport protein CorC [Shewanella loihica]|uniref:Magnesium and cobalt efflux protein CorC n=1 Tax=Shewanella loihica (strain ATCC BAA-1088 / PV-4) TaxID=323850 RepID=A3QH44_SHELP|nr:MULTISPECIES: CNNM family magnesium/cobalt transport protein CorC [Shewanella]ABO24792.1 CBS domain containing protein [Shewanella loihica PV-4]QYJ81592.1 CNNM family magnesium/cobalt transport protein CorC [Shewanella aegiceratis]QYJ90951.1 CNNM family magnesium/cobalt transport protein CorC [Shewanella halotolerans]QYJ92946.1 CNNM family magnesium/cobalt transport protein CorC [Shewanella spartinae]QYJ96823.1 CNNM family magnesium/cobalt transport protein CorC [Shewanella alkalitolerans]